MRKQMTPMRKIRNHTPFVVSGVKKLGELFSLIMPVRKECALVFILCFLMGLGPLFTVLLKYEKKYKKGENGRARGLLQPLHFD